MSWRRILLLTSVLLFALGAATWYFLQRSGAATGLVRTFLERALAARFELGSAQIDVLDGRLSMQTFAVADPARPGQSLLAVDNVRLAVETDAVDGLLIHDVEIVGAHIDLDLTAGRAPQLDQLLRPSSDPSGKPAIPDSITPLHIGESTVRVLAIAGMPAFELSAVELRLQRNRRDEGEPDPRHGSLTGSARVQNLGVDVALLGDVDLATGRCRLQAQLTDVPIDDNLRRALQPFVRTELPADAGHGMLHSLTAWCELSLTGATPPVFGATFELDDVTVTRAELPVPLRGANVRGVADTRDGGSAQVTARRLLPYGETELVAKIANLLTTPQLEVRAKGRDLPLDDTVLTALRSFKAGRAVVEGLRPTAGRADVDLYLRDPGGDAEIVDLDLGLKGVALSYHGFGPVETRVQFPLPIVQASGHVHLRDNVLSIEEVSAQLTPDAGGGDITMSGRIDLQGRDGDQVGIDIDAPRLQFTPALRQAFAMLVRDDGALYDQFQPVGAAAVRLRVRPHGDPDGDWQVRIEALGGQLTWGGFPLPLQSVHGTVLARPEGMEIKLQGARGDASVQVEGSLLAPPERPGAIADGRVELRIRATGVPLDDDLHKASVHLAPQLAAVWDELQPSGRSDADLSVRRDRADAEMVYDLALRLTEGRALPRSLPLPITALHGDVLVHGTGPRLEVQVDTVRGRLQERDGHAAELAVIGTVRTDPSYAEDLTAVVRQLDLDADLGHALEQAKAMGPGTWSVLRPSGKVDVVCRQFRSGLGTPQHTYTVLMRDVQSTAEMLPQPATEVSGELDIQEGVLTFRDLRARVGKALVTCAAGHVGPAADPTRTEVQFTVGAERFPLDDNFAKLFLGPLRKAVLDRQLRGALNVNNLSLKFLLPADGTDQPIETVLEGDVEALDVEILLGTRLTAVNGVVHLNESHVTRDGGLLHGNMTRGSFTFLGHPCVDAQADFAADAERFVLRNLGMRLHGGSVRGRAGADESLVYVLARQDGEPGHLRTDLDLQGLSLSEFLHDCGFAEAPYSGTLNGSIKLNDMRGVDLVQLDAEGALEVVDGNLGPVPLFTSIYALMEERNRPRFQSLSVQFKAKDRLLQLDDLVLTSPLVAVRGEGSMTLEGYLYVVLTTDSLFGGNADVLVLPQVLQWLTSSLVRFHLFGHLRDLHAEKRWIAQRDPRRPRLSPVAPRLERPRRPDF